MKKRNMLRVLFLAFCFSALTAFAALASNGEKIEDIALVMESYFEVGETGGDVEVWTDSDECWVESWEVTNEPSAGWKSSSKPKISVVLESESGEYYFPSGFSKNDIELDGVDGKITGVSRKSATKLVVTVTLNEIEGDDDDEDDEDDEYILTLEECYWDEEQAYAVWDGAEDAKKYEIKFYRSGSDSPLNDGTITTEDSEYYAGAYITKSGSYYFKVRAVYNSSHKGSWETSDGWLVDTDRAEEITEEYRASGGSYSGTGISGETSPTLTGSSSGAWLKDSVGWWYCNADHSYPANCWQLINDRWYFFNGAGYMTTGWILWNNIYYYCDPSSGAMLTNTWTPDGYYVDNNGVWVSGMTR